MPNVVATDAHDLESLIFRSSSLRSVLAEFGNAEKINRFEDNEGQDVRTALLERALVFGRLRWAIRSRATAASSTRCGRQPQRHVRVCQSKQGRCGGHRRWRNGILCHVGPALSHRFHEVLFGLALQGAGRLNDMGYRGRSADRSISLEPSPQHRRQWPRLPSSPGPLHIGPLLNA